MKNFYNQKEIKIIEEENFISHQFYLDIPETYGFNFYHALDKEIVSFIGSIESVEKAILFQIIGDFDLLENADSEGKRLFIQAVINIFISHLKIDGKLERERRLSAPKSLDNMDLSVMNKLMIVNSPIKFPIFSLEILNKSEEIIYKVI